MIGLKETLPHRIEHYSSNYGLVKKNNRMEYYLLNIVTEPPALLSLRGSCV